MKFLGTGLSGLVGSRIVSLLSQHEFVNFSLENGFDITDPVSMTSGITSDTDASWVLHLAAYTNVQQAELDAGLGEQSMAWKVNVKATETIVEACKASHKRLLYIDTDYAFDGTKDIYYEEDAPNPLCWYAKTKSEGAIRVLAMGDQGLVIRISNPYRANPVGKKDFVHKMIERLETGGEIVAPDDQLFVPTFIDDIAHAIETLVTRNSSGIFHVTGSQSLSPFEAALTVAKAYGLNEALVKSTTFASYFSGRAPVPQKAVLSGDKLRALGVVMHGFTDGVEETRRQEASTS